MTRHYKMDITDQLNDVMVEDIVSAIKYNIPYVAFAITSYGDQLIYACMKYIEQGKEISKDEIGKFVIGDLQPEQKTKIVNDLLLILNKYHEQTT